MRAEEGAPLRFERRRRGTAGPAPCSAHLPAPFLGFIGGPRGVCGGLSVPQNLLRAPVLPCLSAHVLPLRPQAAQ